MQIVCKNNAQCVQNKFWSPRDAFIAKTDMLSPVYSKCVHNISLLYKCTQNQFAVQAYSKPVYCKGVQTRSERSINLPSYKVINCYIVMCSL